MLTTARPRTGFSLSFRLADLRRCLYCIASLYSKSAVRTTVPVRGSGLGVIEGQPAAQRSDPRLGGRGADRGAVQAHQPTARFSDDARRGLDSRGPPVPECKLHRK